MFVWKNCTRSLQMTKRSIDSSRPFDSFQMACQPVGGGGGGGGATIDQLHLRGVKTPLLKEGWMVGHCKCPVLVD